MIKTVLIVDDDEDLIEIVRSHVEDAGYSSISAVNGKQGLEKARAANPDLIILDIAMPGMTGLEMLEKLRQLPGLQATPVLMLSAQGQSTNIFEAGRCGSSVFLSNPLHTTKSFPRFSSTSNEPKSFRHSSTRA